MTNTSDTSSSWGLPNWCNTRKEDMRCNQVNLSFWRGIWFKLSKRQSGNRIALNHFCFINQSILNYSFGVQEICFNMFFTARRTCLIFQQYKNGFTDALKNARVAADIKAIWRADDCLLPTVGYVKGVTTQKGMTQKTKTNCIHSALHTEFLYRAKLMGVVWLACRTSIWRWRSLR